MKDTHEPPEEMHDSFTPSIDCDLVAFLPEMPVAVGVGKYLSFDRSPIPRLGQIIAPSTQTSAWNA